MTIRGLALVLLLFSTTAEGDTLADARAALQALRGQAPVRAMYERESTTRDEDEYRMAASADVRVDSDGLTITFPKTLVDKLVTQRPRFEAKNEPNVVHAANVSPENVAQLLNYAPTLLRRTEGAKVIQERQGAYGGHRARIVVLDVPLRGRTPRMLTVHANERLTMWIGDDHLPLAIESEGKFSAGILFLRGQGTQRETLSFVRRDDRLIVAKRQQESHSSGFGQSFSGRETESIALK
jgi:hypothetical protein